jgi:hypothetical protein
MATVAMAATLALTLTGTARASDYCLQFNAVGDYEVIGKGFRLPPKNRCKPFGGFSSYTGVLSGTACTEADGLHTRIVATEAYETGITYVLSVVLDLQHPQQSQAHRQEVQAGYIYDLRVYSAGPCAQPMPIP